MGIQVQSKVFPSGIQITSGLSAAPDRPLRMEFKPGTGQFVIGGQILNLILSKNPDAGMQGTEFLNCDFDAQAIAIVWNTLIIGNLEVDGIISGNGSGLTNLPSTNLSSPPPIGNVTPNTAAFTTLSASANEINLGGCVLYVLPWGAGSNQGEFRLYGPGYATSGVRLGFANDVYLERVAANSLALRNGGAAQTLLIGRTYTDASNYSQLSIAPASSTIAFTANEAGTGVGTLTGYSFDKGVAITGTLSASGAVTFTANTASTTTGTGTLVVTGGIGASGKINCSSLAAPNGITCTGAGGPSTITGYIINAQHALQISDFTGSNGVDLFPASGNSIQVLSANDSVWGNLQAGELTCITGNIIVSTAGKGLQLKSGTGARGVDVTLVGGTITTTNTTVTANTKIVAFPKTAGGTLGSYSYTVSAGTSYTINSSSAIDTSTLTVFLFEVN